MSIKLNCDQIKDSLNDGNLNLYFPHDIELTTKPENMKLIEWMRHWGFRADKQKERTNVLYPHSFNLGEAFHKRLEYDYIIGFDLNLNEALSENDFLKLIYSKFLIKSNIVNKSCLLLKGVNENSNFLLNKTLGYKTAFKNFNFSTDKIIFKEDYPEEEKSENVTINNLKGYRFLSIEINGEEKDYSDFKFTIDKITINSLSCIGIENKKTNKVLYSNIISKLNSEINNQQLAYNCFISLIFSSHVVEKNNIDFNIDGLLQNSYGYYISDTLIRLKNLGETYEIIEDFHSNILQYNYIKSIWYFEPKFLQDALFEHCKKINEIYYNSEINIAEDDNVKVFLSGMLEDLELGMKMLGMFLVDKI